MDILTNTTYFTFSLGLFLGVFSYHICRKIGAYLFLHKKIRKPLEELDNRGLDIYTFMYRQSDYVVIKFDKENYIYLDISKQTVGVYKNKTCLFSNHKSLHKEFEMFYMKLVNKFHKEIYVDIVIINNIEYSTNIFSEESTQIYNNVIKERNNALKNDDDLTVDNILDKINKTGIKSLSDKELDFLNSQGDKEGEKE